MNLLKKIFFWLKQKKSKKSFLKNSIIGKDFTCHARSLCRNETGNKQNIIIGDNVSILGSVLLEGNGNITIGDNTTIRHASRISAVESITIGKNVIISNNVVIMDNNSHPVEVEDRLQMSLTKPGTELWKAKYSAHSPIVIEDAVWIGEGASILKGVHIGYGSIVASKAVVTKNIPSYVIAAGNPAKIVKELKNG